MVTSENLYNLAKAIKQAGRIISNDQINKDFLLERRYNDTIYVTSDSGFEAIVIGDTTGNSTRGFMYLYYNNPSRRNSFPAVKTIAALLQKVIDKEKLPEGEGKAAYHDWPEYGGLNKQLKYFSDLVSRMNFIDWSKLEL